MREALSKRPKITSKPKGKAKVSDSRVATKLNMVKTAKKTAATPISSSRTGSKTKPKPRSKTKVATAQEKSSTKVTAKKKASAVTAKTAVKRSPKSETKSTARKKPTIGLSAKPVKSAVKTKSQKKEVKTAAKVKKTSVKPAVKVKAPKTVTKTRQNKVSSRGHQKVALSVTIAPPEPPRRPVASGALRAFEHAVKVFNRRQFEDAKTMFENLLVKFPLEVEIIARTQMYLQVCKQKISHAQITPKNADEFYDRGVYALNLGDFSQAKTFFEKALRLKPDEPHLLYSLAAAHAQTGSLDQALDYLRRTIQLQPRYRTQALNDSDFSDLRENKQFLELLGLASPFDLLQSRR